MHPTQGTHHETHRSIKLSCIPAENILELIAITCPAFSVGSLKTIVRVFFMLPIVHNKLRIRVL